MKKTKRSLFTSLVTLLLCFAMFVGSTFAWFTDTASSTGNRIHAGTLDIDLLMYKKDAEAETYSYQSIDGGQGDIFKEAANANNSLETLWEPGKTQVVYLAVQNKGNLALKYQFYLDVSDHGLCNDGEDNSSLEYIVVPDVDNTYSLSGNYATLKSTLADLLPEENFGDVKPGRTIVSNDGILDEISEDVTEDEMEYFALIVHMKEDAGNVYQGKNCIIDVYLTATQYTSEEDGFGSDQYDAQAQYEEKVPEAVVDIVEKKVVEDQDTVFLASVTPSQETGKQTKITIPKEVASFTTDSTSTMTVKATPTVLANNTFTISSNGAVGAIDLKVEVDGTPVTEFEDEDGNAVPVIIETYVAKNMTNVSLSYNDTENWVNVIDENEVNAGKFFYDKITGRIVYGTTHFSTFVLGANEVAYLDSNNTAYLTLKEAFENADEKDTLTLLKNADMNSDHATVNKDLTFDLNNKTVNMQTIFVKDDADFEIKGNGKLNSVVNGDWTEAVYITNGNLILSGVDITANARYSGAVSFSNEDNNNPAKKQMNLIVSDNTVNSITSTGEGGSAIMLAGWSGDLVSCIKGNGVGTGKLIATAKANKAWSAIRMYAGGATAKVTISGFNGTFISESETYRSLEQGYGNTILVKDMTSGRFSHDETQFMQPGYMTKLNSEGTYDISLVSEDDATCKIVASDGTTTYIAGSIYQALNLAPENSTITLLKDHEVDTYNSQPLVANRLTIDLNNKTVSGSYQLSIKKPDTNPEHNYNVCEPIYVTIKNGTMNTSTRFEENSHITYENVEFINLKSTYATGVMLYSDLDTSLYTWASPAENNIIFKDCVFENYNVELSGREEPQKIDAKFINCTFTKNKNAYDSVIEYGDTYGYGIINIDGCIFNTNFNNTYTYPINVSSIASNIGSNTITLNIKDTSINVTGSETKPVNSGIATVNEQGNNSYKVNGVEVNYNGTAKE